ncbi:MAG: hypothetical protein KJ842_00550 [Candidatus Omnitrophica bacterium]|nr:hypothetical protein [Candidatus Omnitrophota bacterium]
MVYLGDSNKEIESVNTFLTKLKANPFFIKYFNEINVASLDRKQIEKETMTNFVISCQSYKEKIRN